MNCKTCGTKLLINNGAGRPKVYCNSCVKNNVRIAQMAYYHKHKLKDDGVVDGN